MTTMIIVVILLLLAFLTIEGCVENQPIDFIIALKTLNLNTHHCIFDSVDHYSYANTTSHIDSYESLSFPTSQGWSRCKNCILREGQFHVISSRAYSIKASWSQWHEFFADKRDIIELTSLNNNHFDYIVRRPVFVLSIVTLHPGHILIDIIEQVYNSMISVYGRVNREALIVIDVSSSKERDILQRKIVVNAFEEITIACLLRLFTDLPILSLDTLMKVKGTALFQDIHFGLDNRNNFFNLGMRFHPCLFHLESSANLRNIASRYREFQSFVLNALRQNIDPNDVFVQPTRNMPKKISTKSVINVLFVQRKRNRVVNNMNQLRESVCNIDDGFQLSTNQNSPLTVCYERDLDEFRFEKMVNMLSKTDVLVAAAGTAVHNMLFMRPGSSVIILMPIDWCDWAWMYANQAIILGIRPFIYCESSRNLEELHDSSAHQASNPFLTSFQWTRNFWLQGTRFRKLENMTISVDSFLRLFRSSISESKQSMDPICTGREFSTRQYHTSYAENDNVNEMNIFKSSPCFLSLASLSVKILTSMNQTKVWNLKLNGVIITDQRNGWLMSTFKSLSICLYFFWSPHPPRCFPVDGFNYLADLDLVVYNPLQVIHFWLQITPRFPSNQFQNDLYDHFPYQHHHAGKIRGSDMILALDLKLPDGGYFLHSIFVGRSISFGVSWNSLGLRQSEVEDLQHHFCSSVNDHETNENRSSLECSVDKERLLFHISFKSEHSLQRWMTKICMYHKLDRTSCGNILFAIHKELYFFYLIEVAGFPKPLLQPTPSSPFFFLHVEKTGGSTLRNIIVDSIQEHPYHHIIPCYDGISCVTFSLNDLDAEDLVNISLSNVSVLAGHFNWDEWKKLPVFANSTTTSSNTTNSLFSLSSHSGLLYTDRNAITLSPPSMVIFGRHPIERAISYYYERCFLYPQCPGYHRSINNLTSEEMLYIIDTDRVALSRKSGPLVFVDDGMSNALCRALTSHRKIAGKSVHLSKYRNVDITNEWDINLALKQLRYFVVGVVERWQESLDILKAWHPWLRIDSNRLRRDLQSSVRNKETLTSLSDHILQILLEQNRCDLKIYDKMIAMVDDEIAIVKAVEDSFLQYVRKEESLDPT